LTSFFITKDTDMAAIQQKYIYSCFITDTLSAIK